MNKEKKAIIAANLKPILSKYNVKGSLKVDNRTITLTLRQGKLNLQNDWRNPKLNGPILTNLCYNKNFHEEFWSGQSFNFFEEAKAALKSAGYYNNSNMMIDYHDVAYYWDIEIEDYKFIAD